MSANTSHKPCHRRATTPGRRGDCICQPIIVPTIANPFELIAAAAGGPYALDIAQPTETGGATLTVTIDSLPGYGTVQYLNGSTWTDVTLATVLTPAQLASLRYVPPASGEDSGGTLSYSVSDGTDSVTGTMNVSVIDDRQWPERSLLLRRRPRRVRPRSVRARFKRRRDRGSDSQRFLGGLRQRCRRRRRLRAIFKQSVYFFAETRADGGRSPVWN